MENKMAEEMAHAEIDNQDLEKKNPAGSKQKKKASWVRTILWMLSMVLLANVVMGILAYFLLFHNK